MEDFSDEIEVETIYIAREEGVMIGFLTVDVPDNFIHLFFVDSVSQGSGVGSALLNRVEADLSDESLSLKCLCHNKKAISFYRKKGFRIIESHEPETISGYHLMKK